jgi:sugar phosphate isomerase/epimerase
MKLGVCAQVLHHLPLGAALDTAARLGFAAIELPVDARNPFVDLDAALAGGAGALSRAVRDAGLVISALSNHQEGQLLLGPHGRDTDAIHGGDAAEKVRYATARLEKTAALAEALGVPVVVAFTGCDDYSRWFPWPDPEGYERMAPTFADRVGPVVEACARRGVRFAHECHPRQFAYNLETARWALDLLGGHRAFGFNLDPANLMLAGVDPVVFVAELGDRIFHVHAKDGELVAHHAARSGLLAHGRWDRRDRGFRFRVPGWGDLPWKRLLTELHLAGYDGVVAVEHEDPTMGRVEGLEKAVATLSPLLFRDPAEPPWW